MLFVWICRKLGINKSFDSETWNPINQIDRIVTYFCRMKSEIKLTIFFLYKLNFFPGPLCYGYGLERQYIFEAKYLTKKFHLWSSRLFAFLDNILIFRGWIRTQNALNFKIQWTSFNSVWPSHYIQEFLILKVWNVGGIFWKSWS